jgi:hypothetical protein
MSGKRFPGPGGTQGQSRWLAAGLAVCLVVIVTTRGVGRDAAAAAAAGGEGGWAASFLRRGADPALNAAVEAGSAAHRFVQCAGSNLLPEGARLGARAGAAPSGWLAANDTAAFLDARLPAPGAPQRFLDVLADRVPCE